MRDFVYIAPSFTRKECINSIMSIRYSAGGLSFSIRRVGEILFLYSTRANISTNSDRFALLQNSLKRYDLLGEKFMKIEVYDTLGDRLLIPSDEYYSDNREVWLRTLCDNSSDTKQVGTYIESCNAVLAFFQSNELVSHFSQFGCDVEIYNISSSFIQHSILSIPNKHRGYWLFVEYSKGSLDILLTKGRDIQFYNVYRVTQSEEVLFYVIQLMELYNIKVSVNAVFSGETTCGDDLIFATLKRYIPSFSLAANLLLKSICNDDNIEVMPCFVHLIN